MESYDIFKENNGAWNSEYGYGNSESEMQKNYEIAKAVEAKYHENYGNIEGPRIGDIVEFSDGFRVYKHAKIVEDVYHNKEHGLLCVCENGSSHTNGEYFSTSGGSFRSFHKSLFQLVGTDENMVWTWGCHGAGAHQGIYFTLKVRKWLIPYEPIKVRSTATIRKNDRGKYGVEIQNFGDWYNQIRFDSIKAFLAWAEYAGYEHNNDGHGTFERRSPQRLVTNYVCDKKDIPENGKPLKWVNNGRIRDAWVVADENTVTTFVDHTPKKEYRYGTPQSDKEIELFHKYSGNPLGV